MRFEAKGNKDERIEAAKLGSWEAMELGIGTVEAGKDRWWDGVVG